MVTVATCKFAGVYLHDAAPALTLVFRNPTVRNTRRPGRTLDVTLGTIVRETPPLEEARGTTLRRKEAPQVREAVGAIGRLPALRQTTCGQLRLHVRDLAQMRWLHAGHQCVAVPAASVGQPRLERLRWLVRGPRYHRLRLRL